MKKTFQALVVNKDESFTLGIQDVPFEHLPDGEVLIKVSYTSVNYKDGLASIPDGKIVRSYPFVPGIDLAGVVVSSTDSRFEAGQQVLATGYELGVSHYGGFSEYARVPADWLVPLPNGLTLKEAMIYGTAGFTAALSITRLEANGVAPEKGKVLVTGASGGVGGTAITMLSKQGYTVVASTGKRDAADYLQALGASEVITREDVVEGRGKPLESQQWQAAIDPVGGQSLAAILSKITYGGSVAVSGLAGGTQVPTTVFPFILRGVSLLGIDSVYCPMEQRVALWDRLATDLKPDNLESLVAREVTLKQLPDVITDILQSKIRGRMLVRIS